MGYQPAGRDHSITEVMCMAELDHDLKESDGRRIDESYPRWQVALPRKVEHPSIFIEIGDADARTREQLKPMAPVAFEAYGRDGRAEWRMGIEHNRITVGCYNYSRWNDLYINVHRLMGEVGTALKEDEHRLRALTLKYTDVFLWVQQDGGAPEDVLKKNSRRVPEEVYDKYKRRNLWHLHQGWFRDETGDNGERLLEQINIAGTMASTDHGSLPCVTIETTVKADWPEAGKMPLALQQAFPALEGANQTGEGGAKVFSDLHELSKELLRKYLSEEMTLRIGLG